MVTNTIGNAAQTGDGTPVRPRPAGSSFHRDEPPVQPTMRTTMRTNHQHAPNTDVNIPSPAHREEVPRQHARHPVSDGDELKVLTVIPQGPILDLVSSRGDGNRRPRDRPRRCRAG